MGPKGTGGLKRFYGTSENAVKTQIWIAVSVYVLAALVGKGLTSRDWLTHLLRVFWVKNYRRAG